MPYYKQIIRVRPQELGPRIVARVVVSFVSLVHLFLAVTMDSSLITAARDGKLQDVRDLLLKGADINATDSEDGTAFMRASAHGNLDIVVELWKHDKVLDVNRQDCHGNTALIWASRCYNKQILTVVL